MNKQQHPTTLKHYITSDNVTEREHHNNCLFSYLKKEDKIKLLEYDLDFQTKEYESRVSYLETSTFTSIMTTFAIIFGVAALTIGQSYFQTVFLITLSFLIVEIIFLKKMNDDGINKETDRFVTIRDGLIDQIEIIMSEKE